MIINAADLKNAGLKFEGLSNAQITDIVRNDLQRYGIAVNRTFDDANGKTRWMSGQMAQIMKTDPKANALFSRALIKKIGQAGTFRGAMKSVFAKDDQMRDMLNANPALWG